MIGKILNFLKKEKIDSGDSHRFILTKSRFLQFQKCNRLLWLHANHRNIKRQKDFKFGYETEKVKQLAYTLFPDSILQINTADKDTNINITRKNLQQGKTILNAAFGMDELYTQIDILEYTEEGWNVYELKNTPTLKKRDNVNELSFQKYVLEKSGIEVSKCYVIIIDSEYVKKEEVLPADLFIITDFTAEVNQFYAMETENIVSSAKDSLMVQELNSFELQCKSPKSCKANEICWKELGDGDIFHLREGLELSLKYYQQGLRYMHEIPENEEHTDKQKIQIRSEKSGNPYLDKNSIKEFLNKIRYPIYYLDFETINASIPIYKNSRPFQHIPFQFSLHIQKNPDSELVHIGYIEDEVMEPGKKILEILSQNITPGGSIICFEEAFEKRIIRESVVLFPEFAEWHKSIAADFLDLAIPFKSFYYYHPDQKGSTSLKKVIKALTGTGYEALCIQDGYTANYEFLKIRTGEVRGKQKQKVLQDLEEYCRLDTLSLHVILEKLRELVA